MYSAKQVSSIGTEERGFESYWGVRLGLYIDICKAVFRNSLRIVFADLNKINLK
jgi:hypothetical protein